MKYYGGREISDEDLEKALLVGMSPHEKRRLEKKRQSAAKKAAAKSIIPKPFPATSDTSIQNDTGGPSPPTAEKALLVEEMNGSATEDISGSLPETDQTSGIEDSSVVATEGIIGNGDAGLSLDSDANAADIVVVDEEDVNSEERTSSQPNYKVNQGSENGTDGTMPPKHNSKLSLLGHGPHGQQVVDHILKEYGEAGISNFCQRWRQVFVEAIHPRFLPAGWDVMHSGRRDFGDFSVYNPSKKTASGAAVDS